MLPSLLARDIQQGLKQFLGIRPVVRRIELRDEDGEPVPDEEFRVVLPNGEPVRGFLDGDGFQRFGPIEDAGQCQLSFPNLDESAIRPA